MEHDIRKTSVHSIYDILRVYPRLTGIGNNVILYTARCIEQSCHTANIYQAVEKNMRQNWESSEFLEQYSNILYEILVNIDPNSSINSGNTYLIDIISVKILLMLGKLSMRKPNYRYSVFPLDKLLPESEIDLAKIGQYHHDMLNPAANKSYKDEIEIRSQQCLVIKTTKMYTCHECGGRDSKYHVQQTRSGDEGYTVFITCQICGFRQVIHS